MGEEKAVRKKNLIWKEDWKCGLLSDKLVKRQTDYLVNWWTWCYLDCVRALVVAFLRVKKPIHLLSDFAKQEYGKFCNLAYYTKFLWCLLKMLLFCTLCKIHAIIPPGPMIDSSIYYSKKSFQHASITSSHHYFLKHHVCLYYHWL